MLTISRDASLSSASCPPGPRRGLLPERLLWAYRRNSLQFLSGMAREYGDIVLVPLGRRKVYLLSHPDFIRDVLETHQANFSRGQAHLQPDPILFDGSLHQSVEDDLRLLEILQPLYEPFSLVGFKALVVRSVSQVTQDWHAGQVFDLPVVLSRLAGSLAGGLLEELHIPGDLQERALTILQAGQAAMADVLTSALYLLIAHPVVENQASLEAQNIFDTVDPSAVDPQSLVYTRMLLAETLRMYPPVGVLTRQALCACNIGGYTIPTGGKVWLNLGMIQRDPQFFPDPGRFDPQRWTAAAQLRHHPFSFFPFGAGPRRCLGEAFAWLQGVLVLALLLLQWKFEFLPGQMGLQSSRFERQPKSIRSVVLKGR